MTSPLSSPQDRERAETLAYEKGFLAGEQAARREERKRTLEECAEACKSLHSFHPPGSGRTPDCSGMIMDMLAALKGEANGREQE